MTKEIKDKYNLDSLFRYVHAKDNSADMLTRGMTLDKFNSERNGCVDPSGFLESKFDGLLMN